MDEINVKLDNITARNLQPLILASVGDSVHTLFVRTKLAVLDKYKANDLSKMVSKIVNAGNQCKIYYLVEKELNDEELSIAKRARNTHIHSKAKNFSANDYIHATAYEAVLGFLYLTGQTERLNYILSFGDRIYAD
jgi:ribonuclease-3 family protein